jgi:hypothetical protein
MATRDTPEFSALQTSNTLERYRRMLVFVGAGGGPCITASTAPKGIVAVPPSCGTPVEFPLLSTM